jgi:hypothetical protein
MNHRHTLYDPITKWFHGPREDGWRPVDSVMQFNDRVIQLFDAHGYSFPFNKEEFTRYICRITCGMTHSKSGTVPLPKHPSPPADWHPAYDGVWNDWIQSRALPSYDELWNGIPIRRWELPEWRRTLWSVLPYCIKRSTHLYVGTVVPFLEETEDSLNDDSVREEPVKDYS